MKGVEQEILEQLDLAFQGIPSDYYPVGNPCDVKYNFFLDLEHGSCLNAGNRIHLFADATSWAIVFEKCGYFNRSTSTMIELNYVGNCIQYEIESYPERNYISNTQFIHLIDSKEFQRMNNKVGSEMEQFELVSPDISIVKVRDQDIQFENSFLAMEREGIQVRAFDNPNNLIGYGELVRYLYAKNLDLFIAKDWEIRKCIPIELPHIMTLDTFHYSSIHHTDLPPSKQETFQLIARILLINDPGEWKPTQVANNHWKNWESGHL